MDWINMEGQPGLSPLRQCPKSTFIEYWNFITVPDLLCLARRSFNQGAIEKQKIPRRTWQTGKPYLQPAVSWRCRPPPDRSAQFSRKSPAILLFVHVNFDWAYLQYGRIPRTDVYVIRQQPGIQRAQG